MNEGAGLSFTALARTISTDMSRNVADNESAHYCSLRIPLVTALYIEF